MEDVDHSVPRAVVYAIAACLLFRTEYVGRIGLLDPRLSWGGEDVDWCIRIRDAGGEVVYLPAAEVVHSYRRLTRRHPVSRAALRHLRSFAWLQWKYRSRQVELHRLGHRLGEVAA
jgi:GT2 family glycosyltransferase